MGGRGASLHKLVAPRRESEATGGCSRGETLRFPRSGRDRSCFLCVQHRSATRDDTGVELPDAVVGPVPDPCGVEWCARRSAPPGARHFLRGKLAPLIEGAIKPFGCRSEKFLEPTVREPAGAAEGVFVGVCQAVTTALFKALVLGSPQLKLAFD